MAPKKQSSGVNPGGRSPSKSGSGAVSNVGGGKPSNGGVKKAGATQGRTGRYSRGKK